MKPQNTRSNDNSNSPLNLIYDRPEARRSRRPKPSAYDDVSYSFSANSRSHLGSRPPATKGHRPNSRHRRSATNNNNNVEPLDQANINQRSSRKKTSAGKAVQTLFTKNAANPMLQQFSKNSSPTRQPQQRMKSLNERIPRKASHINTSTTREDPAQNVCCVNSNTDTDDDDDEQALSAVREKRHDEGDTTIDLSHDDDDNDKSIEEFKPSSATKLRKGGDNRIIGKRRHKKPDKSVLEAATTTTTQPSVVDVLPFELPRSSSSASSTEASKKRHLDDVLDAASEDVVTNGYGSRQQLSLSRFVGSSESQQIQSSASKERPVESSTERKPPSYGRSKKRKGKPVHPGSTFPGTGRLLLATESGVPKPEKEEPRGVRTRRQSSSRLLKEAAKPRLNIHGKPETRSSKRRRNSEVGASTDKAIELMSDSEEEEMAMAKYVTELSRIAIGRAVYEHDCNVSWGENDKLEISYRKKAHTKEWTHNIDFQHEVKELKYYVPSDKEDDTEQSCFIALMVKPTDENGLKVISNSYNPNAEGKKYVVLELRSDVEWDIFFKTTPSPVQCYFDGSKVSSENTSEYLKSLKDHTEKEELSSRKRPSSSRASGPLAKLSQDDILVVYPFGAEKSQLEQTVEGLSELSEFGHGELVETSSEESEPGEKRGRTHNLTVRVGDYDRLNPGEFLNDTLIDLFMQWMIRYDDRTNIHIFSTHFFTTLVEEGADAVTKWTKNKGIDIFTRKFIFIPINKSLHWSLCVVVEPGLICQQEGESAEDSPFPCLIFLDSLRAHQKAHVRKNVHAWLNSEWERLGKDQENESPFTTRTMPIYSPTGIPHQKNSWDCGVFVCRYAYAVYQLRTCTFSKDYVAMLSDLDVFQFGMSDIARIRNEMRTWILKLHEMYKAWKKEKEREELLEKMKARSENGISQESHESSTVEVVEKGPTSQGRELKGAHQVDSDLPSHSEESDIANATSEMTLYDQPYTQPDVLDEYQPESPQENNFAKRYRRQSARTRPLREDVVTPHEEDNWWAPPKAQEINDNCKPDENLVNIPRKENTHEKTMNRLNAQKEETDLRITSLGKEVEREEGTEIEPDLETLQIGIASSSWYSRTDEI